MSEHAHGPTASPGHTSTTDTDAFVRGLWRENPVFVQVMGMCPALAVTNTAVNGLAMGLASTFVLLGSGTLVSLLRRYVPRQVRIATYTLIIATFVTIADFLLQIISLEVHKALGAFVYLIVVNCVILGRAEAFAARNPMGRSALDALGTGLGFTFALLAMGGARELLGAGSLFGVLVLGERFQTWSIAVLPAGGFFTLAGWLVLFRATGLHERDGGDGGACHSL